MKIMKLGTVAIFAMALLVPLSGAAAIGVFPSAGGYTQMAYDSQSGLVVLYGGQTTGYYQDPATYLHETWTFDPVTRAWTQMHPALTPGGSSGGSMVYDSNADRCILSIVNDDWTVLETWAYDVEQDAWEKLADGPRVMLGQRLAYDSKADRIIMFGGYGPPWTIGLGVVDETWAYDYNTDTWTNLQPTVHPLGRNYIGMTYDSKADRVVLWGDWTKTYNPSTDTSVWTYDYNTNTWQQFRHKKDGPAGRDYIELVYDEKADKIIMYGGYSYGSDETWAYDVSTDTWQQMQPLQNPGFRSRYSMVYAANVNRTILYGGQEGPTYDVYQTDTWSFNLRSDKWTKISPGE